MDSRLSEDRGGSLSFETPSPQSYFKQSSWSRQAHQGIQKRTQSINSSSYGHPELERQGPPLLRAHSGFAGSSASTYFLTEGRDEALPIQGDVLKSNGLVRSQSYPLEGFYNTTGSSLLKIARASSSSSEGCRTTKSKDRTGSSKRASAESHSSEASVISLQQTVVEVSRNQQQANIELITTELKAVQSFTKNSPVSDTTIELRAESSSCPIKEPVNSSQITSLPVGSNVSRTACVNSPPEEGSPLRAADTASLQSHCLAARHCPPGSKFLTCGRRKEMEDTASVVPFFSVLPCSLMGMCCCGSDPAHPVASDLHFFGIYDGHGGSQASLYCQQRLHLLLAEELRTLDRAGNHCNARNDELPHDWTSKWEKTMTDCFRKIDKEVGGVCPNGICDDEAVEGTCTSCEKAIAPENVGTTALVAVVGSCQIVIASCGDSRAVLSRGGQAVALSTDHKPEREDETSRIESAGGTVVCWDGYRVGGFLALSRAIGDRTLKRYVISEPEVTCVQRGREDEVLILASDGLWDVLSNDMACRAARKALLTARKKRENKTFPPGEDPAATLAAAHLVKLALSRGSKDNIGVVVVDLES